MVLPALPTVAALLGVALAAPMPTLFANEDIAVGLDLDGVCLAEPSDLAPPCEEAPPPYPEVVDDLEVLAHGRHEDGLWFEVLHAPIPFRPDPRSLHRAANEATRVTNPDPELMLITSSSDGEQLVTWTDGPAGLRQLSFGYVDVPAASRGDGGAHHTFRV